MAKKRATIPDPWDQSGAVYTPERDGTLEEYFETHNGISTFSRFKGFEHFEMLRKEGWLAPRISVIRLMWNVGRGDEHFGITPDYKLEGMSAPEHGGRSGISEPRVVSEEGPCFEVHQPLFPRQREQYAAFLREMEELEKRTTVA